MMNEENEDKINSPSVILQSEVELTDVLEWEEIREDEKDIADESNNISHDEKQLALPEDNLIIDEPAGGTSTNEKESCYVSIDIPSNDSKLKAEVDSMEPRVAAHSTESSTTSSDDIRESKTSEELENEEDNCTKSINFLTEFLIINISAYAILGALLRFYIGELFNNGCDDPNHLLCVTSAQGGLFVDLPANVLGAFLMGFLSTGSRLNLHSAIVLPWLHPDHYFQTWANIHLAIRTGFCGSLTTFASWNAQMVVMMSSGNASLIVSAFFGYVLGVHVPYMSLKFGQDVSLWVHVRFCKAAHERNIEKITQKKSPISQAVFSSVVQSEQEPTQYEEIIREINERAHSIVANNAPVPKTNIAQLHLNQEQSQYGSIVQEINQHNNGMVYFQQKRFFLQMLTYNLPLIAVLAIFIHFIMLSNHHILLYRELWLSAVFAPFGALIRWKLSSWFNKRIPTFPLGTFAANIIGSIVAISAVAGLYTSDEYDEWKTNILLAIKLGFAGCLSTVSTFIDEFDNLLSKYPREAKAYHYVYGSLLVACLACLCIYAPVLHSQ